jgi:hypothetical protein
MSLVDAGASMIAVVRASEVDRQELAQYGG